MRHLIYIVNVQRAHVQNFHSGPFRASALGIMGFKTALRQPDKPGDHVLDGENPRPPHVGAHLIVEPGRPAEIDARPAHRRAQQAPAVAAVQSLSSPMATVLPMGGGESPRPRYRPKMVRQALLLVWTGCIPREPLVDQPPRLAEIGYLPACLQCPFHISVQGAVPGNFPQSRPDGLQRVVRPQKPRQSPAAKNISP